MFLAMRRVQVAASDFSRSRRFYGETLGLPEAGSFEKDWVEFELGPVLLKVVPLRSGEVCSKNQVTFVLSTSSLDATLTHLKERGVTVSRSPHDEFTGRSAEILDPDGYRIIVFQPSELHPDEEWVPMSRVDEIVKERPESRVLSRRKTAAEKQREAVKKAREKEKQKAKRAREAEQKRKEKERLRIQKAKDSEKSAREREKLKIQKAKDSEKKSRERERLRTQKEKDLARKRKLRERIRAQKAKEAAKKAKVALRKAAAREKTEKAISRKPKPEIIKPEKVKTEKGRREKAKPERAEKTRQVKAEPEVPRVKRKYTRRLLTSGNDNKPL